MTTLNVPDMTCGHCKAAVETAIARVDPGAAVQVDLGTRRVTVQGSASPATLIAALDDVGFPASVA
jgi:copper chaperone